jgi:hypothetical protein
MSADIRLAKGRLGRGRFGSKILEFAANFLRLISDAVQ